MKTLMAISLIGFTVISVSLSGKCIRTKHRREQLTTQEGTRKETFYYSCQIKSSESENFDDGYCKNCGCHVSDHDNT